MKKIMLFLLSVVFATLYLSCDKDNNTLTTPQEELLIEQIAATSSIDAVNVMDLPLAISSYVKNNHPPFEIELAFHAPQHGYEVFLENGLCLFFDLDANHLNHDGMHGDMGNHHGGGDHSINFCLAGDTLNVADLPQAVLDHIAAEYPGASCITFIVKPSGKLGVEISTGDILMFSPNGDYHHICDMQATGGHGHWHGNIGSPGWHCDVAGAPVCCQGGMDNHHNHHGTNEPCWGGTGISVDDLPAAITVYLDANHPDETIIHAMQTFNYNYFLRLSDCARLVFDEVGNILFDSGG